MGLPARPTCSVRVPAAIFVGEPITMHVELTASREIKVDFIDVRVAGRQGWSIGTNDDGTFYMLKVPDLAKRVMTGGTLPAGTHLFPLSFTLPHGTAPSHEISPAHARLKIDVHVSIPWWPDGRYSFVAPVRLPPPDDVARTPLVTRHPFDAPPGAPRIELSLASSTLAAGETVVGSCAIFHMADGKARDVDIEFEPRVTLLGSIRSYEREGRGYRSTITLPAGTSGEAVPFRIRLPEDITPTFRTATHKVAWYMKVSIGSMLRGDKLALRVPLRIVDARATTTLPPMTIAPRVADERVVAAFERFAPTSGMTVVTEELDRYPGEQPALVRDSGDTQIRIGYAYRGERGTFLVGRIAHPPLGLGLSVTPSSGLRELLTRDIEIAAPDWDRAHHVAGRSARQVAPFLRQALRRPGPGTLVRWTDDELVVERNVGGIDDAELAELAGALDEQAIAIVRARDAIVPPLDEPIDLAAWTALAQRLRGQLVVGDLSIANGKLDAQPVDICMLFDEDGTPLRMRVAVGAPQHGSGPEPTERVQELVAATTTTLPDAALVDGVATATLALTEGIDATRVLEVARQLRAIIGALYETSGPYR